MLRLRQTQEHGPAPASRDAGTPAAPQPAAIDAFTDLPATGGGAAASRAAIAAQLQRTYGNQAVQAIARGAAGQRLQRTVRISTAEHAGLYDSASLKRLLDAIAEYIEDNTESIEKTHGDAKVKRGPLPFVHDLEHTYVFADLAALVDYMISGAEPELPWRYQTDPVGGQAAAGGGIPPVPAGGAGGQATAGGGPLPELRAFGFPSRSLRGVTTHIGNEVKLKGGGGHTISKNDHEDMLNLLTVDALTAASVETDVARHDFQNFGSRKKDDFCNYQVQIGGSNLNYKRKDTSFSAVIVDKRLLEFDLAGLLARVKEMHRESYTSHQNVILTTDDAAGADFIKRHGKE